MTLQITRRAARYDPDPRARAGFDCHHWIRLPALLDPQLLRDAQAGVDAGCFAQTHHTAVASASIDLRMEPNATSEMLVLLCNDPAVLAAIRDITGRRAVTRFNGSVYRMLPATGHQQEWHDDLVQGRLVALTVNLGTSSDAGSCEGGVLEIRERGTGRVIAVVRNTRPGDAVLFRLDRQLEHRVTALSSGTKTAFAGWFRAGILLRDELRAARPRVEWI